MSIVQRKVEGALTAFGATICGLFSGGLSLVSLLATFGVFSADNTFYSLVGGVGAILFARGAVGMWDEAKHRFEAAKIAAENFATDEHTFAIQ